MNKPKVALVLSTGAARGIAHIGVIEELERQGYEISSIAGCSMGALIGAAYAAGRLQACKELLCSLNNRKVMGLVDFTLSAEGLLKGNRIMKKLSTILPDVNIEDLPIPYTAVATNVLTDREVVFDRGSLHDAIRASISLPMLFVPVKKQDMVLIDGGITNPLPLSQVRRHDGDLLVVSVACEPKEEQKDRCIRYNKFSLLAESSTMMVQRLIQYSITQYKPDIVVRVPTRKYSLLQLGKAALLIEEGAQAARKEIVKSSTHLHL